MTHPRRMCAMAHCAKCLVVCRPVPHLLAAGYHQPWRLPHQASFTGIPPVDATNVPAYNQRLGAMCHCAHYARVCLLPCSHNCETRIFFSQNMPKTPVTSQTSFLRPTQKLFTRVPDVCPSTNTETIDSSPRRLSFDRRINY